MSLASTQIPLEDKAEVRVTIETPESTPHPESVRTVDDPTGCKGFNSLIGIVEDARADMAEDHDHYLYGSPRR